jgi:hypothetical protein
MAIASELQVVEILNLSMQAFKRKLVPIMGFSIGFNKDQTNLRKGDTMRVPYYPLVTQASKDFNGTYAMEDVNVDFREVKVDQRKYQPTRFTSTDWNRFNWSDQQYAEQIANKLAFDVITDILGLVTAANFGSAVSTGAASDFDLDEVNLIKTACDEAEWPEEMRQLILKWTYFNNLLGEPGVRDASQFGGSEGIRQGVIPSVSGFSTHGTNGIPGNSQNLVGMAAHASAILIGFSPITPEPAVMNQLQSYDVFTDPEGSGLTLERRVWGDPNTDQHREVLEVNYGRAVGEAAALKRIVSA